MTMVTGTVKDPDGHPVAEAAVLFVSGPGSFPDTAQVTGSDGRFSLEATSPGTYRVKVNAPGHDPVSVDVDVADEPEVIHDVELS